LGWRTGPRERIIIPIDVGRKVVDAERREVCRPIGMVSIPQLDVGMKVGELG